MSAPAPAPSALPAKPLYSGPAGMVWSDGLKLYNLTAEGVRVQAVMPGGPHNQPSPVEMEAVQNAAQNAYGPLKPWMASVLAALVLLGLSLLNVPLWLTLLLGLAFTAGLIALPVSRQYAAFKSLFEKREEVTILLSDTPTNAVSNLVDIGPDTPAQKLDASRQPVAVVVRGLPVAERVKLAGAVTRQLAMGALAARRGK
ncbi:hypothetical protein ACFP81_07810 [Deinococcus lacus]|uniref:Uncharacterized protein n=1 Tax=Deinococcus lacus TaxID=392561 RepID=A0ABW1YFF7_9DEIO